MTKIADLTNYYSIEVLPMDKDGNLVDGECRCLYLHKSKFKRLAKYLDKLHKEGISK